MTRGDPDQLYCDWLRSAQLHPTVSQCKALGRDDMILKSPPRHEETFKRIFGVIVIVDSC